MSIGELAGYTASILVFVTFYMKTMVPLRILGILSNIAFITYSSLEGLVPIFILHASLLPLNLWRLQQILRLGRQVREAADGQMPMESLLPFMSARRFAAGEVLFRKDDISHEMFYIRSGRVRLPEIGKSLGRGSMLGEISVFSPSRKRTATAVGETDGELLCLSDRDVLRLYYQNPRFGFHIVRLITRRLIENYTAIEAATSSRAISPEAAPEDEPPADRPGSPGLPDGSGSSVRSRRRLYSRLGWAAAAAALVAYSGWFLATYVTSVLFRDAAVTTWINVATSPITGNLEGALPAPGQRVGADGRLITVRNRQADPSEMERAAAEVDRAEARVRELEDYLAEMRRLDAEWRRRTASYASTFKRTLGIEIEGTRRELDFIEERLTLERSLAERIQNLARRGDSPQSVLDEAMAEVMELERQRAAHARDLAHTEARRRAAERDVFLVADGRSPEWAHQSLDRLHLEITQATRALADARADLVEARAASEAARRAYELISAGPVVAPPGSLVWSSVAGAGAAVARGAPVAEWIDCRVMLVDVPVRDVAVGLLRPGMAADVLIEGEAEFRAGNVLLTRGAASTLDGADLAATAKGRGPGLGQAILSLEATPEDVEDCAIGSAAWVDFPGIDLIDVLRARLRL